MSTLLKLTDIARVFDVSPPWLNRVLERKPRVLLKAVDGVSLSIERGETVGLVGESGCGKSTVARLIVGLHHPSRGRIEYDGIVLAGEGAESEDGGRRHRARRSMQMIFQDPYASLNPRKRVGTIISDPMRIHGIGDRKERKEKVEDLLRVVGLSPEHYNRFPHEFSGGQRPRDADPSSPTSRCRRSTSPCRRRSSTCSRTCRPSSA